MKHPKQNAGYRIARRTGPNRTWVTVYDATEAKIDVAAEWAIVCETHGAIVEADTRTSAEGIMRSGSTSFCDECRDVVTSDDVDLVLARDDGSDVHEQAARWRKVARLLAAMHKHEISAKRAVRLGRQQLKTVAKCAGVNPPSDTTIKLLRETLRSIPPPS